ncbi:MAG: hypothetical protein II008_09765 [Oscillospiraceae bacterium]|nr:hypothetical protein [Oscillospiraceae bacterium]
MNIYEILDGLQKSVDEMKEERMRMISLEERVMSLIEQTEQWFAEHAHELPEKGG